MHSTVLFLFNQYTIQPGQDFHTYKKSLPMSIFKKNNNSPLKAGKPLKKMIAELF